MAKLKKARRAMVYRVNQPGSDEIIENTLETWQKLVGGYVERLPLSKTLALYCNEEGRAKQLPHNRDLCAMAPVPQRFDFVLWPISGAQPGQPGIHRILGDFFVVKETGNGGITDLTDKDVEALRKVFP